MNHGTLEREIHIDATPEVVFDVVSNPEHVREWWPDEAEYPVEPGGAGRLGFGGNWVQFTVVDAIPPKLFSFRWAHAEGETAAPDGAVFDQATAEDYAKNNADAKLKVTKTITTTIPHGFAVRKGNTELITKINDGLKKVVADGTWVRVHDRFEPAAPVPADFKPGQCVCK